MYEIVKSIEKVEKVILNDIGMSGLSNKILLCEKERDSTCQGVLVRQQNGVFFWNNFYTIDCSRRTRYENIQEAISSRYEKGYKVFLLQNKTELKDMLKHR